ncbi:uncharacterized protein LOC116847607 [Odontomachus brunneus]|uniref:uncharacterized protein LOC116847607 n=1 Tax=Odontomachus brunneus TaxID=486640 RepID=UPI0013F1CECA|nr:uncharacterized protein LOC116847607 [Odontomachus brunneus]
MLYDAQQSFCNIYNNPLLIWFASLMIHVIANIRIFREESLIAGCAFVCPPILQVLTLCMICHYTAEEANKIACILNEVMCTLVSSGQTMVKIDTFIYFLHNRVSFEAAGFFTIDLPLFQSFSDKLETYDDKATLLGHRREDKHMFISLYFTYTLTILIIKTYLNFSLSIEQGTIAILTVVFEDIIPVIIGTYCIFITVIYLDLIRQRFRHLNKTIVPKVSELPVTGSQGEITVYDVRYLHGVLIDSAELINDLYGFGTLTTFMSILLEFVAVIYLLIEKMEKNNIAILTMLDLSFQTIYLFAMYHFVALEANRIEESVEKYGLSFQNTKCRMDKIEMMLYFYHARFYFTAVDFFILDLTLFLSIFSTVATFMTIII